MGVLKALGLPDRVKPKCIGVVILSGGLGKPSISFAVWPCWGYDLGLFHVVS